MSKYQCPLCKTTLSSYKNAKNHLINRKTPCVKNKELWKKRKEYVKDIKELVDDNDNPTKKNKELVDDNDNPIETNKELVNEYKPIYNQEQLAFINSPLCDLKLLGKPGAGKTSSIIAKIKQHVEKEELESDEFLILTFSVQAMNDFVNKGNKFIKIFNQGRDSRRNVRTIHSLAGSLLWYLNVDRDSYTQNTAILHATQSLTKNPAVVYNMCYLQNVKIIFVDEAQDLGQDEFNLINALWESLECYLVMVGDPNQSIYGFKGGKPDFLLEFNSMTVELIKNYRSTPYIVDLVNNCRPHTEQSNMISGNNNQNNKVQIFTGYWNDIVNDIIKQIVNTEYSFEQIAIISPTKLSKENSNKFGDTRFTNFGMSIILNALAQTKIKWLQFYSDSGTDKIKVKTDKRQKGHINLHTIHTSKGLEFDKVILLNFHHNSMGKSPSIKKHQEYKYMWYVGLSRAKYELNIYCLNDRKMWYVPNILQLNCVEFKNDKPIICHKPTFEDDIKKETYDVTELCSGDITPENEYKFEQLIKFTYNQTEMGYSGIEHKNIYQFDQYACLYGMFIELVFEYYYHVHNDINLLKRQGIFYRTSLGIQNTIHVNRKYTFAYNRIQKIFPQTKYQFSLNNININSPQLKPFDIKFINYLYEKVNKNPNKIISLSLDNVLTRQNHQFLFDLCRKYIENPMNDENIINDLFKIALHHYQLQTESGYLWEYSFDKHIESVSSVIEGIKEFTKNKEFCHDFIFQIRNKHPRINLFGITDILNENTNEIIEIKFTKELKNNHIYQLALYHTNMYFNTDIDRTFKVFNLLQGIIYEIKIKSEYTDQELLQLICEITDLKQKEN